MTKEELYFQEVTKNRKEIAAALANPAVRGLKDTVVDKYSDQAHFIYELLQNADDANATKCRFILEKNQLIFAHNGTRHFNVSDVSSEKDDKDNGTLGDINAITSVGSSNKDKDKDSIGRFGVGFKSVFQYTSTPHIYDTTFKFKIVDFLVPELLDNDFSGRLPDETLFVFPFNNPKIEPKEAYLDIAEKLQKLSYPNLFLRNLNYITFQFDGHQGEYQKRILDRMQIEDTEILRLQIEYRYDTKAIPSNLWLFSRVNVQGYRYSIGFFLDENHKLAPVKFPAFCFFPTKEYTGLNFAIHAPFVLTDSREGIKAGHQHNKTMIALLSRLAADGFRYLKDIGQRDGHRYFDDCLLKVIPYNLNDFAEIGDRDRISFKPFYTEIKNAFMSEAILPTKDGYIDSENAYWAASTSLTNLFDSKQLSMITGNPKAQWVFTETGRDGKIEQVCREYIDEIVKTYINDEYLINGRKSASAIGKSAVPIVGIQKEFIEKQSVEWLFRFYGWICETRNRMRLVWQKEIFLDQYRKAAAAYDDKNHHILFLPSDFAQKERFVNYQLMEGGQTKELLKALNVQEISLKDKVDGLILPLYERSESISLAENIEHVSCIFSYFKSCSPLEHKQLIKALKKLPFLQYLSSDESFASSRYKSPDELNIPTDDLRLFLRDKGSVYFININAYINKIGKKENHDFLKFLESLGISRHVKKVTRTIETCDVNYYRYKNILPAPQEKNAKKIKYEDCVIDGCEEIIAETAKTKDKDRSFLIWQTLIDFIKRENDRFLADSFFESNGHNTIVYKLEDILKSTMHYSYRTEHQVAFASTNIYLLQNEKWLCSKKGTFVSPKEIGVSELDSRYQTDLPEAKSLIQTLNFNAILNEKANAIILNQMSEAERKVYQLGLELEKLGYTLEDLEKIKQEIEGKEKSKKEKKEKKSKENDDSEYEETEGSAHVISDINGFVSKINRADPDKVAKRQRVLFSQEEFDEGDYDYKPVDYQEKINRAKEKSAFEVDRIAKEEFLQNRAVTAPRYSYLWFKSLLEMEEMSQSSSSRTSHEVSISFGKVIMELDSSRTLILQQPSHYIPSYLEDLSDFPLNLHFDKKSIKLMVEAANVQNYNVRVKIKEKEQLNKIDFSAVKIATINIQNPDFLIHSLQSKFDKLGFEDNMDMQKSLIENIEFVFGPPGTGKTTYLAKQLLQWMDQIDETKVLVLTPTNKAADVLTKRIIDIAGQEDSCKDWLIRFGTTADEEIEKSGVYHDRSYLFSADKKSVVITTIARYTYDFFANLGHQYFLDEIDWDYIVVDEASMIPLANIVYPLYKQAPKKFLIAGDPFQIEPVAMVKMWQDENIYKMVHLNSFSSPQTVPYPYKIHKLTKQYRSVPEIGNIYSSLTYNGILEHHRSSSSQKKINLDTYGFTTLNIIKFPVSTYESIYRPKKLQQSSSYQIYCALFTFEFTLFLAKEIAKKNPNTEFSIGVIAPYRAQADLIDKLITSAASDFPKSIHVMAGTIHSFQGDECDVILDVFNTPPKISKSKEIFVNKKNIVNVSISRARDYLFLLMPDDETENIQNLELILKVERYMKGSKNVKEFSSAEIEKLMFGREGYLEESTFTTSHQNVNVYGLPERLYEIRSEDAAIDIQIRKAPEVSAIQGAVQFQTPVKNVHVIDNVPDSIPVKSPEISNEPLFENHHHPVSNKKTEYTLLEYGTSRCPFDKHPLRQKSIVETDGNKKAHRVFVYECPKCHSLYKIKSKTDNKENQARDDETNKKQTKKEYVFAPKKGKGEIIGRKEKNGKTYILVKFKYEESLFAEEESYEGGYLTKLSENS
jgi:hypothetical protein